MKMFINMTKPSPVMAALAEMQGKSFVLSSNQLENLVFFPWSKWCNKERCLVPINVVECHWKFNSTRISTPYTVKRHEKMWGKQEFTIHMTMSYFHDDFDVENDNCHPSHFFCSLFWEDLDIGELYLRRRFWSLLLVLFSANHIEH